MEKVYEECLAMGIDPDKVEIEKKENVEEFVKAADKLNEIYIEESLKMDEFPNGPVETKKPDPEELLWKKHFDKKYKK